jgi:iron complex transport system substrate-binding protein
MTPREIDDYVRAAMAAGEDLYTLRTQALAGLDPDLILTQDLCRVCALPSGQVEEALGFLGCRADVLSLDPHSLEDVLSSIRMVGDRTGRGDQAQWRATSGR